MNTNTDTTEITRKELSEEEIKEIADSCSSERISFEDVSRVNDMESQRSFGSFGHEFERGPRIA